MPSKIRFDYTSSRLRLFVMAAALAAIAIATPVSGAGAAIKLQAAAVPSPPISPGPLTGATISARIIPAKDVGAFRATHSSSQASVVAAQSNVVPFSSGLGCSGSVCMQLLGTGLKNIDWYFYYGLPYSMCTFGTYWVSLTPIAYGPTLCGSAGDVYYTEAAHIDFYYASIACSTGLHVAGRPCETVHP